MQREDEKACFERKLTVKEVAQRLGISGSLVYALVDAGSIRHSRHGRPGKRGCIRISEVDLQEYLASCVHVGTPVEEEPLEHIH